MTDHLDRQRRHLAELLGLDPDDPAVWRALAIEQGEMVGAEDTLGRDNGQHTNTQTQKDDAT
jgi:hypothetical protein